MPRHQIGAQGGVVVALEVGPVERNDDLFSGADDELDPARHKTSDIERGVAQPAIDLFNPVFGMPLRHGCVGSSDGMDGQNGGVQHPKDAVRERFEALFVEGLAEEFVHEVVNIPPVEGGGAVLGGREAAGRSDG